MAWILPVLQALMFCASLIGNIQSCQINTTVRGYNSFVQISSFNIISYILVGARKIVSYPCNTPNMDTRVSDFNTTWRAVRKYSTVIKRLVY